MSRLLIARSVFDGLSTVCFITALVHMKLADVAAVLQIAPLIITALSVMLSTGEAVGWRRWTAIGVGFVGALFVVKPTPVGVRRLGAGRRWPRRCPRRCARSPTRRIGRGVPVMVIAFMGLGRHHAVRRACSPSSEEWRMFETGDLVQLLASPRCSSASPSISMVLGFRDVDLSVVAPFRYSYLITSAIGGYLVFGELPDRWSVVGALLIVGSGLYALHREAVRRRKLTAEATTAA